MTDLLHLVLKHCLRGIFKERTLWMIAACVFIQARSWSLILNCSCMVCSPQLLVYLIFMTAACISLQACSRSLPSFSKQQRIIFQCLQLHFQSCLTYFKAKDLIFEAHSVQWFRLLSYSWLIFLRPLQFYPSACEGLQLEYIFSTAMTSSSRTAAWLDLQ